MSDSDMPDAYDPEPRGPDGDECVLQNVRCFDVDGRFRQLPDVQGASDAYPVALIPCQELNGPD